MKYFIFTAIILPLATLTKGSYAHSAESNFTELVRKANAATFSVGVFNRVAKPGATNINIPLPSSGFFINNTGLFLTSRHNIPHPMQAGDAIFIYQDRSGGSGFFAFTSRVVLDSPELDLMLVQFSPQVASRVEWLPLSDKDALPGEELAVIGIAGRLLAMTNRGTVLTDPSVSTAPKVAKAIATSIDYRTLKEGAGSNIAGRRVLETDVDFATGFSGGPIISAKSGQVVGMISDFSRKPLEILKIRSPRSNREIVNAEFESFTYGISVSEILPSLNH